VDLAFFKPWLTALAMPPASSILVIALGLALMLRYRSRLGISVALLGLGVFWLFPATVFLFCLAKPALPQVVAIDLPSAAKTLQAQDVQAIIVLGGGAQTRNREYGNAQPSGATVARLHYGVVLSRATGLPLGFSGGLGWAADSRSDTEAQTVQRWLSQLGLPPLRWAESTSRDTQENALRTAALLQKDGVQRVALVTHAWHMPRAQRAFEKAGLYVLPAPMGYTEAVFSTPLEWLPSEDGLRHSRQILRELLGIALARSTP
jgi:uncharacterized SAM-binding protein YcdF (DUF218 family)